MSLRTRLTVIVAVIVAVAVVGGAYAAHVSAQHALDQETDKFLRERASGFVQHPPQNGGRYFPGAPDGDDDGRYFQFDAVQQTIDRDGQVSNSLPNQPQLPIDESDRQLARTGGDSQFRDVTVNGQEYRMITAALRNGGAVQIAREVSETDDVLDVLRTRLVIIALAGIVLTREQIYERIWGFDFETSSKSLDVYISYLRRKTEEVGESRLIHTVRGVGYTARPA